MNNFKREVPNAIQEKMQALALYVENEWENIICTGNKSHNSIGDTQQSEIEGNYVSGWMPNQDGGFMVSKLYYSDIDSSYHFTEKQTDFVNESSDQCYKAFLSDNDIEVEEYDQLTDEQKDSFGEYERNWFDDGALLQWQCFVEGYSEGVFGSKEKLVTMRISINYKDAPYFREKSAEDIKTLALSIDEFMSMPIEDIAKQFAV